MPSFKTVLVATAMAVLAQASTIKIVATSNNTFNPSTVRAVPGDILEFYFQSMNHSVVAGDYHNPCAPLPLGSGFFSGFMPVQDGGEDAQTFRVVLTNADPLVFYSSQGVECPNGMSGMVNPTDQMTLAAYQKQAAPYSAAVTPGNMIYGGELGNAQQVSTPGNTSPINKFVDAPSVAASFHASILSLMGSMLVALSLA